jgi:hypothetical protein
MAAAGLAGVLINSLRRRISLANALSEHARINKARKDQGTRHHSSEHPFEQALQTNALRKIAIIATQNKQVQRYPNPVRREKHPPALFRGSPYFKLLFPSLPIVMVQRSDRFGWLAVTGILILIVWAILRLWVVD